MSEWVAVCDERDYELMGRVARSLDASAEMELVGTPDALRRTVFEAVPGELGVIVGQVDGGVSDVNLAAAIAHDGNARRVVLARWGLGLAALPCGPRWDRRRRGPRRGRRRSGRWHVCGRWGSLGAEL